MITEHPVGRVLPLLLLVVGVLGALVSKESEPQAATRVPLACRRDDPPALDPLLVILTDADFVINGKRFADDRIEPLFQILCIRDRRTQLVVVGPDARIAEVIVRARAAGLERITVAN